MSKQMFEINSKKYQLSTTECHNFFDRKWQLYQKVLAHNYLNHQESYKTLGSIFEQSDKTSFRLLDLGCGDASFIAKALQNTKVTEYCGLDISSTAIQIAKQNISLLPCKHNFIKGDLLSTLPLLLSDSERKPKYDFILSSFAFHHFNLLQKETLFKQIAQLLDPDGTFILIDFLLEKDETRESYINRYLVDVQDNWQALTLEEIELISDHMWGSDYPETQMTLSKLASNSGFQTMSFYPQQQNMAQVCCFIL